MGKTAGWRDVEHTKDADCLGLASAKSNSDSIAVTDEGSDEFSMGSSDEPEQVDESRVT